MITVGQFPHTVKETENEWITLADGCRLAARMWMPDDAEKSPVPAILEYLPYRKRDGTATRDELTHPYFAGHGYACIRVDMRGNGEADGIMEDEYLKQEQDDALEVIEWLISQPWCDGNVGMIGISWGGFNGLQVAARQPDALKAVITICSTDDRYADDIHYKGGCLLNENLGWGATMFSYSSRPPDPALVGDRWRDMWLDRLKNNPLLAARWLSHPHRDEYWKHGSICEDFSSVKAAVLAVGGWGDAYSNAIPRMIEGLTSPCRAITGPWHHKYPHFAVPEPRIGFLQESLRWWDRWLKGHDTGVMEDPLSRAYMLDSVRPQTWYPKRDGRWISEDTWPSKNIKPLALPLSKLGIIEGIKDDHVHQVSSPQDIGLMGGEFCVIWLGPEMPGDQRSDDAGSLVFNTEPLDDNIEIFGAATLDLDFSVDKAQANVAVRLCDVAPDGSSTRVSIGVLNLCHRDSHENPTALEPGKRYKAQIKLDDIAYAFPKGHRIRLAISTAYWPLIWPSPETPILSVYDEASVFTLPVRPVRPENLREFPPAEAAPARKVTTTRRDNHSRNIERDMLSGTVALNLFDDFGESLDNETGLISGGVARETYNIHPAEPLAARATTHWTETLSREGWDIRIETWSSLHTNKDTFYVFGRIEAYENDDLIYEHDYEELVQRNLL